MKRKLSENWKRVEQRVKEACGRVGRKPSDVTIVAVTKYTSLDIVRALVDIGVADLGENRVGEFTKRAAAVNESLSRRPLGKGTPGRPRWHMIGHLQRNKVKALIPWVDVIHSVDSLRLAEEIDVQSGRLERRTPIFLQVNVSEETSKHGVAVAAATHLAEQICSLEHLELRGMMAMGPVTDDLGRTRYAFGRARELFDEIVAMRLEGVPFRELSLGMSKDFEYAIEVGATHIRVGSALFEGLEVTRTPAPVE